MLFLDNYWIWRSQLYQYRIGNGAQYRQSYDRRRARRAVRHERFLARKNGAPLCGRGRDGAFRRHENQARMRAFGGRAIGKGGGVHARVFQPVLFFRRVQKAHGRAAVAVAARTRKSLARNLSISVDGAGKRPRRFRVARKVK